ncbi:MAG: enoyl-CoA hydratase-related protein [Nibricoccus sp.]
MRKAIEALGSRRASAPWCFAGETEKAFIGGADIKEMATLEQKIGRGASSPICAISAKRRGDFPRPVIARIPGWCLGGGLELAISCDFRIASDQAKFAMPEVQGRHPLP